MCVCVCTGSRVRVRTLTFSSAHHTRAAKRQKEEDAKTICGYTDENNRWRLAPVPRFLHPAGLRARFNALFPHTR